jgi:hypothetical protein
LREEKIACGRYETSNFSGLRRQQLPFIRVSHRKLRKTIHPAYLLAYYSAICSVKQDSRVLDFQVRRQRNLCIDPKTQIGSWAGVF